MGQQEKGQRDKGSRLGNFQIVGFKDVEHQDIIDESEEAHESTVYEDIGWEGVD